MNRRDYIKQKFIFEVKPMGLTVSIRISNTEDPDDELSIKYSHHKKEVPRNDYYVLLHHLCVAIIINQI